MAKTIVRKPASPATEKPATQSLFHIKPPTDNPSMDPRPEFHLSLLADNLQNEITNLESVEELAGIDDDNDVVHAMCFGIAAVRRRLRSLHGQIGDLKDTMKPWEGGAA